MNRLSRVFSASLLATSLGLAGCSLAPTYQRPQTPLPAHWADSAAHDGAEVAALGWQAFVANAQLRQLIERALTSNRDLRQTLLDVEAARAQYGVQRAERLPHLELQGNGNRQRLPADLGGNGRAEVQSSYQAGLGLTAFELDLFGRVRNLSEAAREEYLASAEAAQSARISLVGEVIQVYLGRAGAQRQQALAEATLAARETSLELIAQRRQAGTASALDYQEALGLREQTQAELERTRRELRQADNALQLLLGDGAPLPTDPPDVAPMLRDIAAGTPSELLARRPDIRAAEHRLKARNASIGAARAAFFPRISLTGLFGSSSAELGDLFSAGQRAWVFAPQIGLPIFDGGRNRANLELAELRKDIAVAQYEQSIQNAFREVADALAATDTLRREQRARQAQAQSSREALHLAQARYRAGVDDHLRYLDAQRNDFTSQSAAIDADTQRQIALATLFRALGGGWPETPALAHQPPTGHRE